jgi:uracil-DNA glycosylase
VLVCLGRIAFEATWRLLETRGVVIRPRPAFAHGAVYRVGAEWSVIAAYHPSRQNTNTGRLTPPMLEAVFQEAKRRAGESSEGSASPAQNPEP